MLFIVSVPLCIYEMYLRHMLRTLLQDQLLLILATVLAFSFFAIFSTLKKSP
jgi:hypothetical protein